MEPITRRETLLNQIADNTSGNAGSIDMEPITREEVYLKQIADNTASGGGGGSDLPAVTSEDNGDVLTVVNGAWDKAAPSGGAMIIHTDTETWICDKTWQQVHDALVAGTPVYYFYEIEDEAEQVERTVLAPVVQVMYSSGFQEYTAHYVLGEMMEAYAGVLAADTANGYLHL